MLPRTLTTLLLFFSLFLLPWWVSVPVLFAALIFIPKYIEGCVLACIFDLTYAGTPLFGVIGSVTYASIILYVLVRYILMPRLRQNVFTTH